MFRSICVEGDKIILCGTGYEISEMFYSEVGNKYKFQGRRFEPNTNLYYFRNRYYNFATGEFMTPDPARTYGHGTGTTYEAFNGDAWNVSDPMGLDVSDSLQEQRRREWFAQTLPQFKGFESSRYQQHDALLLELTWDFNHNKKKYCGCTLNQMADIPDIDPAMAKSWLIQETGGGDKKSTNAWSVDPAQVNVPGDWNEYKTDLGLTEPSLRNEGTLRQNLEAALSFLCRKAFGGSGQSAENRPEGFFDDWRTAFERYGPGGQKSERYAQKILDRMSDPSVTVPIEDKK